MVRIRAGWQGRISGCILGKWVEVRSARADPEGLAACLRDAEVLPLRDDAPPGRMDGEFVNGAEAGFDLGECSDNPFNIDRRGTRRRNRVSTLVTDRPITMSIS